jgi:WD40 repeat protein
MPEHNDQFTPESVDEQIEYLSQTSENQSSAENSPGHSLVHDLRHLYHSQAQAHQHTLEQAWQRISREQDRLARNQDQIPPDLGNYRPGSAQNTPHHSFRTVQKYITTIAAVLITALLIGSLLVVLNVAHQRPETASTPTTAPLTPTPHYKPGDTVATLEDTYGGIHSVDWSKVNGKLVTTSTRVQVWDPLKQKNLLKPDLAGLSGLFTSRWSPDGKYIATASPVLQLWNASTGEQIRSCTEPGKSASNVSGEIFAYLSSSAYAYMQTLNSLKSLSSNVEKKSYISSLSWSPDGKYIALTLHRQEKPLIAVLDTNSCGLVSYYTMDNDIFYDVAWSPDGRYIAASTADRTLNIWEFQPGQRESKALHILADPSGSKIYNIAWSPDSQSIATTSYGSHRVETWNARTGKHLQTYLHEQPVYSLAWSPDGRYLACGSIQKSNVLHGEVWLWKTNETNRPIYKYSGNPRPVLDLAWSPDSRFIASADGEQSGDDPIQGKVGTVKVWVAAR